MLNELESCVNYNNSNLTIIHNNQQSLIKRLHNLCNLIHTCDTKLDKLSVCKTPMKKKLGQFYTTHILLKAKVFEYIKNTPNVILEPSFGQGDLVAYTKKQYDNAKKLIMFDIFEIDETIPMLQSLKNSTGVKYKYCDFLTETMTNMYSTIIGNPPYVKTTTGNLYIDFINKCYKLLKDGGELIFVIPSDFFKLTTSKSLLTNMLSKGTFTHIYHPNDENLFENASIDVLIFRYVKDPQLDKKVIYESKLKQEALYIMNSDGLVTFTHTDQTNMPKIEDFFNIYVGIVSGKDAIYKNSELGNISVLCKKDNVSKFIYTKTYPSNNPGIDSYLLKHKDELLKRKIKTFNENNWFEWGAPRNIKIMENDVGAECIYINNITRNPIIAFKGTIQYFGGSLIMLKPKTRTSSLIINKTIAYLNSHEFKKIFTYSNRFKIGHRQLSKSFIDI